MSGAYAVPAGRLWGLADVHKRRGGKPFGELQPRHPTGNGEAVGEFAFALRHLEI